MHVAALIFVSRICFFGQLKINRFSLHNLRVASSSGNRTVLDSFDMKVR